jgi:hypothetical protein
MSELPPLATMAALQIRLGADLEGADYVRAEAVLDDISHLARDEAGKTWFDEEYDTLEVVPGAVQAVVLAASRREYLNPDRYASEQAGDYSYRLSAESASGGVFTDSELKVLHRYRATSGLWTQQITGSEELYEDTMFIPVEGGGDYVPMFSRRDMGLT